MEGLQHDPCQMGQVKTKAHEEAEAMEEQTRPSEAWSKTSASALTSELVVEDTTITVPLSEPLLGLILRMPASLQHVFTDGSPVILPLEVELAGRVEPQTIATPIITTTPGCFSLPLIFDQPHMQYISHLSSCPISEHQNLLYHQNQNNGLSQNLSSLPVGQSHSSEGKSNIRQMSENTMMHSFDVLAALQELFPFFKKSSSSACPSSFPFNAFNTGFMPPNTSPSLAHLYSGSPLLSTLPPATLLVPFPLVVPLPVPLPIPIPPFSGTESHFKPSQTMKTSKSTQTMFQTMTEDVPVCTHNTMSGYDFLQLPTQPPPPPPVSQEEVLDLSVKVVPTQTKQEFQVSYYQDKVLDLSVANKSRRIKSSKVDKRKHHERNSTNQESTIRILPKKHSQTRATNQLNAYSDVELSMHYKWTTEEHYENYDLKYLGKNDGVITPKQIPRVSQSTKDTSVMSCEKLIRPLQGQVLENRVIKQKRTNAQNINIPPIKKQHLMRFLPRK